MIYLDNAATTYPKPISVRNEVADCILKYGGNPGRSAHKLSLLAAETVWDARAEIADYLGIPDPSSIIFTPNATFALNLAIRCRVKRGDHILIGDREHNAVLRPVFRLKGEGIAEFSIYSGKGDVIENIREKERKETSILICNPVSNVTGDTLPVRRIASYAKARGFFLILDGAQWIGHGVPDHDVVALADAIAVPGHKALYGIMGGGFLYLKTAQDCAPFVVGGSGSDSASPSMPTDLPERFEAGTLPLPAIASLLAGVRFVREYGCERIAKKEALLNDYARNRLSKIPGIVLYGDPDNGSSVLSFREDGIKPEETALRLDRAGIAVRAGLHCAPLEHKRIGTFPDGTVRISYGVFNTKDEIDYLASILENNRGIIRGR